MSPRERGWSRRRRGACGRCGDAVRVLHEGGVLLADSRGHSTKVRVSCSTHDPWPVHPHPRAVAALRGARAEAHDDEAFRDPHRSGWQRRIELIVPVSATHRAPACWPCNSGAEHRSRLVPPGSPPCSRLRSRDTHTSWKIGVSLQLGVARGLIGGLGQVSSCWPGPFPSVLPGLGELAAFLPPTRSRSRLCC